jgi:U3 small nucleolar RNA-associated protein MPP10
MSAKRVLLDAEKEIDDVLHVFNKDINAHPEKFVQEDQELETKLTKITKTLFDIAKQNELPKMKHLTGPLKSLIVDGFDCEQIWEELNMQNDPLLDFIEANLDALRENDDDLELDLGNLLPEMDSEDEAMMDEDMDGVDDSDNMDDEDMSGEFDDNNGEDEDDDLPELEPVGSKGNNTKKDAKSGNIKSAQKKGSAVDDDFFKLADLEKFLDAADEQGDNFFDGDEEDDDKDEEDEDDDEMARDLMYGEHEGFGDFKGDMDDEDKKLEAFFKKTKKMIKTDDDEEDEDEDEEDDEGEEDPTKFKYSDFFAPPKTGEDDDEMEEDDDDDDDEFAFLSNYEKERQQMNNQIQQLEREVMDEESDDDDGNLTEEQRKSRHEIRQKRLEEKIRKLEEENLGGRGWQLLGEIQANKRPVNSLLEEPIEFQHATKVAPTITQEVTTKIEDLVRQRIIDGAFDDVIKRIEKPKRGDHRDTSVDLDATKSKKGLGELYEEDYLKQTAGVVEETEMTKEHQEVAKLFRKICFKLDALAHAQFAPTKVRDEIEIKKIKDVAAIQMEEILPVAVSDAQRLAPEEIYEKDKLNFKADEELDSADKKRLRRRRKHHHKVREETKENEIKRKEKLAGTVKSQASAKDTMKTLKEGKNIVTATQTDSTNYSASAQMFSKLQKEAGQDMQALKKQKMEMYNADIEKKKKAASQSKALKLM